MQEAEVLIRFPDLTDEQRHHLYKAASELNKAGVQFDTGVGCAGNDWEFDWSLKGAKVFFKKFSDGKLPSGKPIEPAHSLTCKLLQ